MICPFVGQLPWRGNENEKSSWGISSKSWHSTSHHPWCKGKCFHWKVGLLFLEIMATWLLLFFFYLCSDSLLSHCFWVYLCSVSSLAWFMSNQETSFVTLGQRVLAYPLKWAVSTCFSPIKCVSEIKENVVHNGFFY